LRRIGELSAAGAEQLRSAIFALKQRESAPIGLVATLRTLARSFEQRTGVDTDLLVSGVAKEISDELGEAVHAIAREALANVERHAHASSVVLELHFRARTIQFVVQDDGAGSHRPALNRNGSSTKHFGLAGLRERVRALHGGFHAGPNPSGGFTVRARIPLAMEEGT
jgi:signal transduction histidine kinase